MTAHLKAPHNESAAAEGPELQGEARPAELHSCTWTPRGLQVSMRSRTQCHHEQPPALAEFLPIATVLSAAAVACHPAPVLGANTAMPSLRKKQMST
ncbi:Mitogen-Activated Protein Kinase Kinase Kinase 21 [Manis pentadactyla]|nr:Mitogen-Activated Protein Kinase Kinase Kinase 21 [Manis pentadactyla]